MDGSREERKDLKIEAAVPIKVLLCVMKGNICTLLLRVAEISPGSPKYHLTEKKPRETIFGSLRTVTGRGGETLRILISSSY